MKTASTSVPAMVLVSPGGARIVCALEHFSKAQRNTDGTFKINEDGALEAEWRMRKPALERHDLMPRMYVDANGQAYLENDLKLVPAAANTTAQEKHPQ